MTAEDEQTKLPAEPGPDHWLAYLLGRSPYAAVSLGRPELDAGAERPGLG